MGESVGQSLYLLLQVLGFAAFFALVLKKVDQEEYGEPAIEESLRSPGSFILYPWFFFSFLILHCIFCIVLC